MMTEVFNQTGAEWEGEHGFWVRGRGYSPGFRADVVKCITTPHMDRTSDQCYKI